MAQAGLEERMAKIEGTFQQIDQRLGRLETEITTLRSEMKTEIQGLRQEMRHDIKGLRQEIQQELNSVREDLKALYRMALSVLIPMWVTIIGAIIGIALTR